MTVPPGSITDVAYCVQCARKLPHEGTSWRESARCQVIQGIYAAGAAAERQRCIGRLAERWPGTSREVIADLLAGDRP